MRTRLYIPPPRREWVPRPRLLKRLEEGLAQNHGGFARKLTLISAPAGFGKTTLLSQCIAERDLATAWVSLDKGDNDPFRFWTYVTAALEAVAVEGGRAWPVVPSPPDEAFLTALINAMTVARQPVVLVLDDVHLVEDGTVHSGLVFLVENLPPHVHLILAGRADPPWPMARLRARGELTELRAPDLRFTAEEAGRWLKQATDLDLTTDEMSALDHRIEGWAAGLQMAALSLQGHKQAAGDQGVARFIRTFTGSHRFVLDYLMEEVISQQSKAKQEFLLRTSVLERMCAGLCDAVMEGTTEAGTQPSLLSSPSQAFLEQLEATNLFLIPLDDERHWYRYHHLFADLLRSRFEQEMGAKAVRDVHTRASLWYEQQGLVAEAVKHAIQSDDFDRVARLVEENALQLIYYVELKPVMRWLDAQPADVMHDRPWLSLGHAWALLYAGRFEDLEPRLSEVEAILDGEIGHDGERPVQDAEMVRNRTGEDRIRGHIAAIRSYATWLHGNTAESAELARKAMAWLPDTDTQAQSFAVGTLGGTLTSEGDLDGALETYAEALALSQAADNKYLMVIMLCQMANVHRQRGQLHKAAELFHSTLQLTDEHSRQTGQQLPVAGYAQSHLSQILYEWNDLQGAADHAQEGLALCKLWGQKTISPFCEHRLARILYAQGEVEPALKHARAALQAAREMSMWSQQSLRSWQARIQLAQGDQATAATWAQDVLQDAGGTFDLRLWDVYSTLAEVQAAQGHFDPALDLLGRLLVAEEAIGRMDHVIHLLVLKAQILHSQGHLEEALPVLDRALSLAEPEGYVRSFVDRGEGIGTVLKEAAARNLHAGYAQQLLEAWQQEAKMGEPEPPEATGTLPQPALIDPLSEREQEVLRYLNTSLTVPEIAEQLYVAVSTVRSHTKNIYSKLDVHSRVEALHRAEELGLL
ncbi:MAG: LuxR C-terminal-related transcriptional regulator [Anaerolineae bacterium]